MAHNNIDSNKGPGRQSENLTESGTKMNKLEKERERERERENSIRRHGRKIL